MSDIDLISEMLAPVSDAPQECRTVKLVEQGLMGLDYNLLRYLDRYWAVHWQEESFEIDRILADQNRMPMFVADSVEEIKFCLKKIHGPFKKMKLDRLTASCFQPIGKNFYLINLSDQDVRDSGISTSPIFKNKNILVENLFDMGNGDPITIISPAPARTCNYRCAYCYHHDHGFTKNTDATGQWAHSILTAAERIPRPIRFSAGAMGEPLFIKEWRETAIKLMQYDNVISLALVSNLSQPTEPFFDHVDPKRVGLMASLHPSEFKDHDDDFVKFLDKLAKLKALGVDLCVNYVLIPDQMDTFLKYRKSIFALGIAMTSNVLRGPYKGKFYPDDFTPEQMKTVRNCYDENSYIFDSQSHYRNPYGLECVSGRKGFYLEFDGGFFNCHFARQRLGSIFDDTLMVRTQNGFCTASKCESQTTIGWQADIESRYVVQKTLHHYVKGG
jgi:MoaA/NifB/PqqE/SkfB family radical SAM enzyme